MAKIVLNDVTTGNTSAMNANFQKIEQALNNVVLYRDNPLGEANQMESDLDMNSNDILNAGVVKARRIVADSVESNGDSLIEGGLQPDELIKWDNNKSKFVGTGVFSKSHGEITTSNNSVNIGVHDVGSAGRNVILTNRVDNHHFNPVVQGIGIEDTETFNAVQREHGSLEELRLYTDSSTILTDPAWLTTTQVNRTVLGVKFWPAVDMTDIWYEVYDRGQLIYEVNLGDFKADDTAQYKELSTPYDLYDNSNYMFKLVSRTGGVVKFRGGSDGKPWFLLQIRVFHIKELATKEYVDLHAGAGADVMTKSVYDIDGDGVVDVAKTIVGASTAGDSKYFGTDFDGTVGFHALPNNSGGSGEPSDYTQVKAQVTANTQAITNHAKQIQSNLEADTSMAADLAQIKSELPDIRNELNDNTSKIETNISNIKELQSVGRLFTYAGATGPTYPSSQRGNYIVVLSGQANQLQVATPNPTGGLVDGTVFTLYNESDTFPVVLSSGSSAEIESSTNPVTIPPENYVSYVYRLKPDNFIELESGYIPTSKVNLINYIKTTLSDQLHTEGDIRAIVDAGGYIKGMTIEDTEGHSFVKVNKLIFDDLEVSQDSHGTFTAHVKGGGSTGGITGIEVDDGTSNAASVTKVNVKGSKITKLPSQEGMASGEIELTSGINITNMTSGGGSALATKVVVVPPLQTYIDPNQTGAETVRLELTPSTFEPLHAPSFLAYLKEDEEVVGKLPQGKETDAGAHHNGAVWFDDIVVDGGAYIETRPADKSWGIQEADELDPNISGGTDYLIAARIHMKGTAPSNGFVRLYLYNKSVDPFEPTGYLLDKNGQPMIVERHYLTGQELGVLDVMGIVNATGLQEFSVHVVDTFQGDVLTITDRTEGASGLMIQALKSNSKTGLGLLQFESDTNQNIEFSTHYLGDSRFTLQYYNERPDPVVSYTAGTNFTLNDGILMQNKSGIKLGTVDGRIIIEDDGVNSADFVFGKVFSAEETGMLRGKTVTLTTTTTTKQSAARVLAIKWLGSPDAYTKGVVTAWSNDEPTFEANWSKFDEFEIVENVLTDDNETTKVFTVPTDAVNYGFILVSNTGPVLPFKVEIKDFKVDVTPAFIGYSLHAPEMLNELHLKQADTHNKFTQDKRSMGGAGLRYTINVAEDGLPMPVGYPNGGKGPVVLDPTVNQIQGSSASGGEGALEFTEDGNASIFTQVRLWNETDAPHTVKFWWAEVSPDGKRYTKLADSEFPFEVPVGARGTMYAFRYAHDFEKGARIALRASTDVADGAFLQCLDNSKPLVNVDVEFKYIASQGQGDDPWVGLDLSQFDYVYQHELVGKLIVRNAASVTVPFVIDPSMFFEVKRGIKIVNNVARPLKNLDYSYSYDTHELRVSFGELVEEARILVGVYL